MRTSASVPLSSVQLSKTLPSDKGGSDGSRALMPTGDPRSVNLNNPVSSAYDAVDEANNAPRIRVDAAEHLIMNRIFPPLLLFCGKPNAD
ncbi:hypothetical protein AB9K34_01460 [Sedimentitalea sp. XS_ASV28]